MTTVVVPGQILASKFRVERVIGQGGMGVVVSAFHLELHERVALKFLLPEAMNQPNIVERFTREARNAVRIRSEHVARVTDVGRLENGAPYIVMEYLDGVDLGALVSQQGGLAVADAADFVIQATEALAQPAPPLQPEEIPSEVVLGFNPAENAQTLQRAADAIAAMVSDRVIGLSAGRLVFDGPASALDDATVETIYGSRDVP